VGTGPGVLRYTVAVPGGLGLKDGASSIRLEQLGEPVDTQAINGSVEDGEISLTPGVYAAQILLTNTAGKTAVFREAVSILSGLVTEIAFAPQAAEFLDSAARAVLTAQVLFKTTADNSSGIVIGATAGSDVRRTLAIKASRENAAVYFTVQKLVAQTLVVSGDDAAKVSKPGTTTEGSSPSVTLTVFSVDIEDIAETGGTKTFIITAGENGKTVIDYVVTVNIPRILSLSAKFQNLADSYAPHLTYYVGDAFDYNNFTVYSNNSDGSTLVETGYTLEGFDNTTPGVKTVKVKKNDIYAEFLWTNGSPYKTSDKYSAEIMVLERINSALVFDYGSRVSSADTPMDQYTTPVGRSLVLAPVKWNIPEDAVYAWTVSGGDHTSTPSTTEYFTFNPTVQGEYTVTVSTTVNGQTLSASTKVECCPPEGTYQNTAKNFGNFVVGYAPGQFTGVGVSAADQVRGAASIGGFGGTKGRVFTASVRNSGGYDLRITGNAFGTWLEPGVVWVAQDSNGNGKMDDTWHELKGEGVELMRRYAVTYHPNGSWQDNLGNAGTVKGGATWWPRGAPSNAPITYTGTRILGWPDPAQVKGYVDTQTSNFRISDAIQADGSPVHLEYIDFVMVKTGEHLYTDLYGEKSTEVTSGIEWYNPYDDTRRLAGVQSGNNYAYKLVNNSGYALTVSLISVASLSFTDYTLAPGATENLTLVSTAAVYFDYSGGNVTPAVSGNTVTFTNTPAN
jgi:hypothetical protein